MISIKQKGDLSTITRYLEKARSLLGLDSIYDKYGQMGVEALSQATPVDSGLTAQQWRYKVVKDARGNKTIIEFHNDNVNEGVNIAIILQYGHGTGTGGWVAGRDYINPAIQPIFDELAEKVWKEATR